MNGIFSSSYRSYLKWKRNVLVNVFNMSISLFVGSPSQPSVANNRSNDFDYKAFDEQIAWKIDGRPNLHINCLVFLHLLLFFAIFFFSTSQITYQTNQNCTDMLISYKRLNIIEFFFSFYIFCTAAFWFSPLDIRQSNYVIFNLSLSINIFAYKNAHYSSVFPEKCPKKNNIETFIHVICCNNSINSILQTIFFMTFDYVKLRLLKIKRTFLIFLFLPLVSSSLNSWHDLVVQHSIAGEYKFCSISHFRGRANYY